MHKIFAMKCDDLIVNYLQHVRAIWGYILDDDPHLIENMDYASVQILELTCPSMSESDAEMIRKSPICGSLSEQQRAEIESRILRIDTLIPSFRSLFEDLKYLEILVNALKRVHKPQRTADTLRSSLLFCTGDVRKADKAWRELFLYSMRNYYKFQTPLNRDSILEAGDASDLKSLSDMHWVQLSHLGALASRLNPVRKGPHPIS